MLFIIISVNIIISILLFFYAFSNFLLRTLSVFCLLQFSFSWMPCSLEAYSDQGIGVLCFFNWNGVHLLNDKNYISRHDGGRGAIRRL